MICWNLTNNSINNLADNVDILRAIMRPAITIILMFITGYITRQHLMILDANRSLVTAETLFIIIYNMI